MRRLIPRSLAARITLLAVTAVGVALAIVGVSVLVGVSRADRRALDRDLGRQADRIAQLAERRGGPPGLFDHDDAARLRQGPSASTVDPAARDGGAPPFGGPPPEVLDPGADRFSRVVYPDGSAVVAGAGVPTDFPKLSTVGLVTVTASGERWRVAARRLRGGVALQVAGRLAPLDERTDRLRLVMLLALAAGLLGTGIAAASLVRVALRPLGRLRGTAAEVAQTADLSRRVAVGDGPVEIDALAMDVNAMLARLETSAEQRETALQSARRFAADAGHELRTPLTSLKANLDTVAHQATGLDGDTRAALTASAGDAQRLQALVEQLQALARGEAGPPAAAELVDLSELADAAVIALRVRHPEVTAELRAPQTGPMVSGDPESLRMLLDNLLENAAVHGRERGTIITTVSAGGDLAVADDGPGIAPYERARVLERFVRGADARGPGTGLGLAIAAAQAARHGGVLVLGDADGGGLRASVALPVASPARPAPAARG